MRKIILFINLFLCSFLVAEAQQIPEILNGKWMGELNVGIELRIVFNLNVTNDTIVSTLDSPDQGVNGIATGSTTFDNNLITITIPAIGGKYTGTLNPDSMIIYGMWEQPGGKLPLDLKKTDTIEALKRPQNPVKPYPYKQEEISFQNKETSDVTLAGTLTIPEGKGPFKAVILVTGSGPQNRDEFLLGHSPFLVLSDYLTRAGIIVLRYDDRGMAESTGDFNSATSKDFASDVSAGVNYLSSRTDLNISRIGIAGHSEGGLIAPMVAVENDAVDFIVLLAGTGIPGDSILLLQSGLISKASGYNDTAILLMRNLNRQLFSDLKSETDNTKLEEKLIATTKQFLNTTPPDILKELQFTMEDTTFAVAAYLNPWMQYFINYDPRPTIEKLKIPVLAINGSNDLQVPPKENLEALKAALEKSKSKNYKTLEIPGLNHLFQTSATGNPGEYAKIEETFNPGAMQVISDWILSLR